MKIKIFFTLSCLFFFSLSFAQNFAQKKKYSVLGSNKEEIYGQFDEYDKFQNIKLERPSGTIISEPTIAQKDYKEPFPESVQEIAGRELLDYLDDGLFSNMGYSRDKWKKKDALEAAAQDDKKQQEQKPLPPGITTKLPFESTIYLSGRKLIGFDFSSHMYDKEEDGKRKNSSSFKMDQELYDQEEIIQLL